MVTKEADNDTAKEKFIQRLNQSDMYFIPEEFPKNESDEKAHVRCGDVEGAKKYCPTRWRAIQKWFAFSEMVSELSLYSKHTYIATIKLALRTALGLLTDTLTLPMRINLIAFIDR